MLGMLLLIGISVSLLPQLTSLPQWVCARRRQRLLFRILNIWSGVSLIKEGMYRYRNPFSKEIPHSRDETTEAQRDQEVFLLEVIGKEGGE